MPLSRLLAIALLAFPLQSFAQNKQNDLAPATGTATVSEPWRILSTDPSKPSSSKDDAQLQARASQALADAQIQLGLLADPGKGLVALPGDNYCLKIRSYVVARDSKDSDSTHFVSYSTCQPASRYRLKTIELRAEPESR